MNIHFLKKIVSIFILLTLSSVSACAQIKDRLLKPLPPEELKIEVLKVVATLNEKPSWLFPADECPIIIMPPNGRRSLTFADGCKSGPDSCLERCKGNDGDACHALAIRIQESTEIENPTAQALFLRSCKLGIVSGCTNRAADIAESKPNTVPNHKCATDTFEKACEQKDPWACTMFGFALSKGLGREKDIPKALAVLDRACEISIEKEGDACKQARSLGDVVRRTEKTNK